MIESATAYVIRQARLVDTEPVMALLAEATRWLRSKGLDQWQGPSGKRRLLVKRDIDVGSLFVVVHGGQVVATITVDDLADADFWTKDDDVRSALYVHRMAVRRREAGIGLGSALLDWAAARAEQLGRSRLRLDAWATNGLLHVYYKGLGFDHVGQKTVSGRGSGALFERAADVRLRIGPEFLTPAAAARRAAQATSVVAHDHQGLRIGGDLVPP